MSKEIFSSWCEFWDFVRQNPMEPFIKAIPPISSISNFCKWRKNDMSPNSLTYCKDLNEEHLKVLGLEDYRVTDDRNLYDVITQAISDAKEDFPEAYNCINEFTKFLCPLKTKKMNTFTTLASTTFYHWPFCTFFTISGSIYIQPDIRTDKHRNFTILDNMYHESLHQQLMISIWMQKVFKNRKSIPQHEIIYVPWRKIYWGLEHALQACFVYVHLYKLRKQFLRKIRKQKKSTEEISCIQHAINDGRTSAESLFNGITKYDYLFNTNGKDILNYMTNKLSEE